MYPYFKTNATLFCYTFFKDDLNPHVRIKTKKWETNILFITTLMVLRINLIHPLWLHPLIFL